MIQEHFTTLRTCQNHGKFFKNSKVRHIRVVRECHIKHLLMHAGLSLTFLQKLLSSSITFRTAGSLFNIRAAMICGFCEHRYRE
jgi:hypothetical protein